MTLKNPCLLCDHHLLGGDKNDPRCVACIKEGKPSKYAEQYGGMTHSVPDHLTIVGGATGHPTGPTQSIDGAVDEILKIVPPEEIKEIMETDKIDEFIQAECQAVGVNYEDLMSTKRTSEISALRRSLVPDLIKKYGLSKAAVGRRLRVSYALVSKLARDIKTTGKDSARAVSETPDLEKTIAGLKAMGKAQGIRIEIKMTLNGG